MNKNGMNLKRVCLIVSMSMLGYEAGAQPLAAQATVSKHGSVTVLTVPSAEAQVGAGIDFVNAQPMNLPSLPGRSIEAARQDLVNAILSAPYLGAPGYSPGAQGSGATNLIKLGAPNATPGYDVQPQEFGTLNHPFSTAQADLLMNPTNTSYPFSGAGKLFFNIGSSTYLCSASMVKRGVVITAAHCVANFGQQQFYSNWQFVPGYRNGDAPFGVWTASNAAVLTSYFNGTDPCAVPGIVCMDDVAVIILNPADDGSYAGDTAGYLAYGYDGYGFTQSGMTEITQLGYPVCLDNGVMMERNDSNGYTSAPNSNNTVIGSLMCGGSSGGPWVVNFGLRPSLTGTTPGTYPDPNVVVGVTSWGYVSSALKEQGASPFTSNNALVLVNFACGFDPNACL